MAYRATSEVGGENTPEPKEPLDWHEREPFEFSSIIGIRIYVRCPRCGEVNEKLIYPEELGQELEEALCRKCHKRRGIKIPEIVAVLRSHFK